MLYRRAVLLLGDLQDGRRTDTPTAETFSDFGTEAIRTTGVMPGTNANGQFANTNAA